jgi:hypothetical protein
MVKSTTVQGVICKTPGCGNAIPLQEVWDTAPQRLVWRGTAVPDFIYSCKKCKKPHTYTNADVLSLRAGN